MIRFPDTTLSRYSLQSSGTGVYGESVEEYVYVDDVLVDFQNESNVELAHDYGVDLQNLYKAYADIGVTLNDTDRFTDVDGVCYHIVGNIRRYSKFHGYQKINLVRER